MELSHDHTLVERFAYVRYLHAVRCHIAAADTLGLKALDMKEERLVLNKELVNELRLVQHIHDKLYMKNIATKVKEETHVFARDFEKVDTMRLLQRSKAK